MITEEKRKKLSDAIIGKSPWNKGQINVYSEETIKKMSLAKKGSKHTNEWKQMMSEKFKGKPSPMKGKHHSEETKRKISISGKGRIVSEITKERLRIANLGKILSEEHKKKISENAKINPNYGMRNKHPSEETKRKISESNRNTFQNSDIRKIISERNKGKSSWIKGKHLSEEYKRKISESNKGKIRSEETRRKLRESHLGKISGNKGKKRSEESKLKASKNMKIIMQNPEIRKIISEGVRKAYINNPFIKEKIKLARAKQVFPMNDTKIEVKIQSFLRLLGIEFFIHSYISNIKHAYQCDILIPSTNTIIEVDGDYFHANPKKYKAEDKIFRKGMTAKEIWEKDEIRTQELIEKGYRVIRLWEDKIKVMEVEDLQKLLNKIPLDSS
jgi:G:T-mismatch repair DNA endonuclease (very short patch repair protein)